MWVGLPGVTAYKAYKHFKRSPRARGGDAEILSKPIATVITVVSLMAWYGGLALVGFVVMYYAIVLNPVSSFIDEHNAQREAQKARYIEEGVLNEE